MRIAVNLAYISLPISSCTRRSAPTTSHEAARLNDSEGSVAAGKVLPTSNKELGRTRRARGEGQGLTGVRSSAVRGGGKLSASAFRCGGAAEEETELSRSFAGLRERCRREESTGSSPWRSVDGGEEFPVGGDENGDSPCLEG